MYFLGDLDLNTFPSLQSLLVGSNFKGSIFSRYCQRFIAFAFSLSYFETSDALIEDVEP